MEEAEDVAEAAEKAVEERVEQGVEMQEEVREGWWRFMRKCGRGVGDARGSEEGVVERHEEVRKGWWRCCSSASSIQAAQRALNSLEQP